MKVMMTTTLKPNDLNIYIKNRKKIYSSRGGWKIGLGVKNCGFDMMEDLVGTHSYMQVVVLNATGKMPERRLADWIEANHICLSWPDPRIWCNRIGAIAGSVRTGSVAATTLGTLAADAKSYGIKPLIQGAELIQRALSYIESGKSATDFVDLELKKFKGKPHIMGYARPIAKGDERIPAMEKVTKNLKFKLGPHLKLAYQIEQVLLDRFGESMNINGYMSAFLSDQNYSPYEIYQIYSVLVFSGVTACFVDSLEKPKGSFSPEFVSDINYTGKPKRQLPAATKAKSL